MFVFAAAFAGAALLVEPQLLRRGRDLASAALGFAAGLLPYLYLPLASRADPALDWGDPETLDRFLAVVFRRGFWERRWLESAADWGPIAADFLTSFAAELTAGMTRAQLAQILADVTGPQLRRLARVGRHDEPLAVFCDLFVRKFLFCAAS